MLASPPDWSYLGCMSSDREIGGAPAPRGLDEWPRCARRSRRRLRGVCFAPLLVALALLAAGLFGGVPRGAAPASAAAPGEDTMVTVVGRAFGHGIGMSQWGAYGYATKTSLTYKQILRHYFTASRSAPRRTAPSGCCSSAV